MGGKEETSAVSAVSDVSDVSAVSMRTCPELLSSSMKHLTHAWNLEEGTQAQLTCMFDTTASAHVVTPVPEVCLSFWGFPPSPHAWRVLRTFMLAVFQPRVYMASETRQSCVEMMMVIPCDRMQCGRRHDHWEGWMQTFLDQFRMSAGTIVFPHYMSEQMLTCMDRIHNGNGLRWNLNSHKNRDFERLWVHLKREQSSKSLARGATGLEFTASNMIRVHEDRRQLLSLAQEACAQIREERRKMLEMAHTVMGMQRLGLLSPRAAKQSFELLGVKAMIMTDGQVLFRSTRDTVATRRPSSVQADLYVLVRELDFELGSELGA